MFLKFHFTDVKKSKRGNNCENNIEEREGRLQRPGYGIEEGYQNNMRVRLIIQVPMVPSVHWYSLMVNRQLVIGTRNIKIMKWIISA